MTDEASQERAGGGDAMSYSDELLEVIAAGVNETQRSVLRLDAAVLRLDAAVQRLDGKVDRLETGQQGHAAELRRLAVTVERIERKLDRHEARIEALESP